MENWVGSGEGTGRCSGISPICLECGLQRDLTIEYLNGRSGHIDGAVIGPFHFQIAAGEMVQDFLLGQSVQYAGCSDGTGTGAAGKGFACTILMTVCAPG